MSVNVKGVWKKVMCHVRLISSGALWCLRQDIDTPVTRSSGRNTPLCKIVYGTTRHYLRVDL